MNGENTNHPKFITLFNVTDGIHQMFPTEWILAVAPLFEKSELIQSPEPVLGRTLVTLKDRNGIVTNHSLEDFHKILGSTLVGGVEGEEVVLKAVPDRKPVIVVPDDSASAVVPFKKH